MNNMKEINLSEIVSALLRKAWLIAVLAVLAGILSYAYTANFVTEMYRSSITVYVNNRISVDDNTNVSNTDLSTSVRLVATYINILKSERVLSPVAEQVGDGVSSASIRASMNARSLNETEVFEVTISHKNPYMAAEIANAIADVAPGKIEEIIVGSSTKIIDRAKPATAPYTPNKSQNTVVGMAVGAVVAVAIIILQTLMDVRVKGEEDLAAISDAPVLGLIPDLAIEMKGQYGYSGYKYAAYKAKDSKSGEAEK